MRDGTTSLHISVGWPACVSGAMSSGLLTTLLMVFVLIVVVEVSDEQINGAKGGEGHLPFTRVG